MNIFDDLQQYGEKHKQNKERGQKTQSVEDYDNAYNYWEDQPKRNQEGPEIDLGCIMVLLALVALICVFQFFEDLCLAIDSAIRAHAWSFSIFIACVFILAIIYLNTKE